MKMQNMKRPKADMKKTAEPIGGGDYESGPSLHLDSHHMKALGLHNLKAGDKLHIEARGHVGDTHSSTSNSGRRSSATVYLKKMSAARAGPKSGREAVDQGIDEANED